MNWQALAGHLALTFGAFFVLCCAALLAYYVVRAVLRFLEWWLILTPVAVIQSLWERRQPQQFWTGERWDEV